ncbi:MCP four helix bundle domain-containing protein, partial [Euzebya sp.]|uniref:MCP four helix bundle domain-containing protein n=1 Tax=Euzebya sp. TaxID=1971409 RepID=UPI0035194EC2
MTLKKQLLSAFAVVLVAFGALTVFQISATSSVTQNMESLYTDAYDPTRLAGEIRSDLARLNIFTRRAAETDVTAEARQANDAEITDAIGDIDVALPELGEGLHDAEEEATFATVEESWRYLSPLWTSVLEAGDEQQAAADGVLATDGYAATYQTADDAIGEVLDLQAAIATESFETADAQATRSRTISIVVALVVVAGGLALAWSVARTVTRKVQGSATGVSTNVDSLAAVSAQLSSSAEETSAQANVAAAAAEQVSASVQTVSAAVEEMGASVREIAQNTTTASTVASRAVDVADQTSATVAKLSASSVEI